MSMGMCVRAVHPSIHPFFLSYRMALLKTRRTSPAKAAVSWYHSACTSVRCGLWIDLVGGGRGPGKERRNDESGANHARTQTRTHLEAGLDGAEVHGVGHDLVVVLQPQRRRVHGRVEDAWGGWWDGAGVRSGMGDGKPAPFGGHACLLCSAYPCWWGGS